MSVITLSQGTVNSRIDVSTGTQGHKIKMTIIARLPEMILFTGTSQSFPQTYQDSQRKQRKHDLMTFLSREEKQTSRPQGQ